MSLPDFLCIGAQKAGTSWLNKVLLEHPSIFMPPVNELHFFDRRDQQLPLRKRQIVLADRAAELEQEKGDDADPAYLDYLERLKSYPEVNEQWYRTAYSWPVGAGVRKGDITPSYMDLAEKEVAYARELLGPAKIILIVRRPADRLLSQLRMWATRHYRKRRPISEAEWLELLRALVEKESRAAYSIGIPLWRDHFGQENMLILPFSQIKTDPRGMIARVEDHIGVPHFDDFILLDVRIHATREYVIPDAVHRRVAELSAEEDAYLTEAFGADFFEKTR